VDGVLGSFAFKSRGSVCGFELLKNRDKGLGQKNSNINKKEVCDNRGFPPYSPRGRLRLCMGRAEAYY
jgi:hypothetical protein